MATSGDHNLAVDTDRPHPARRPAPCGSGTGSGPGASADIGRFRTGLGNVQSFERLPEVTRVHIYPYLGDMELRAIGPSTVQGWVRQLQQRGLAETYRRTIFANLSGIFTAAIDDERLRRNPCAARSVSRPRGEYPKVVPWTSERTITVRDSMGERYRLLVALGAGCGLRQGEAFGLSMDDVDIDARVVHVVRQVKLLRGRLVFAPPKHGRLRDVPAARLRRGGPALASRTVRLAAPGPAVEAARGKPEAVRLLTWTRERGALNRNSFNHHVWKPALRAASLSAPTRQDGFHALRHFYASVLLDARDVHQGAVGVPGPRRSRVHPADLHASHADQC